MLFRVGVILVPAAFVLGMYGYLTTPPTEYTVYWTHFSEYGGYDQYFDQYDHFDVDHWRHDWNLGRNIQIVAAALLVVGSILTVTSYRADTSRAASGFTQEEIRSWSLPPPEPRRRRRRMNLPRVSRRVVLAGCLVAVGIIVLLVVLPPVLQTYASGPKRSAIMAVTVEDNLISYKEGEFWIYVNGQEEATGVLPYDQNGGGNATLSIPVTWHGDSTYLFNVSCWYDGRWFTFQALVTDQQTTPVRFDVGQH